MHYRNTSAMRNNEIIDVAKKLIGEAMASRQESIPEWVRRNTTGCWEKQGRDAFLYRMILFKTVILRDGYYWETQSNGSKSIITHDPDTEEKRICISYNDPNIERLEIFTIKVDVRCDRVLFKKAVVLADLNPDEFELGL